MPCGMMLNYAFLKSCSRPGAGWRAVPPERDERTPQNPPTPCHVASARQRPKKQAGHLSERAVEGRLRNEVILVISLSDPPLASTVLSRGEGGDSPRAFAPVEPRGFEQARSPSETETIWLDRTPRHGDGKVSFETLIWQVCGGRV